MGTGSRSRPARLAGKLRQVRTALGITQSEMVRLLGLEGQITYTKISHYELGLREPPLTMLLQYARAANVYVEVLIDDEIELPAKLPSPKKSEGVRTQQAVKGASKGRGGCGR
jgi:transcriptional regulator with XRE-family HTH domain